MVSLWSLLGLSSLRVTQSASSSGSIRKRAALFRFPLQSTGGVFASRVARSDRRAFVPVVYTLLRFFFDSSTDDVAVADEGIPFTRARRWARVSSEARLTRGSYERISDRISSQTGFQTGFRKERCVDRHRHSCVSSVCVCFRLLGSRRLPGFRLTFFPDDGEMKFFLAGGCFARARTTGRGGSKPRRDDGKDRRGDAGSRLFGDVVCACGVSEVKTFHAQTSTSASKRQHRRKNAIKRDKK